ncbi:MAG TPA: Ig-like domain repeat protein, partial [Candidatus Dormibacteraeota bacterium]|nr:Ig-like domain repeat protein [Candidatus Dormibacteraeota bacterium]
DGTSVLGTGTLSTSGGVTTASFTTNALSAGLHSLTASYSGDSNFNPSSGAFIGTVTDTDLSLTPPAKITVPATSSAGAVVTFTPPSASDEETPLAVICDHASGSTFPIGSTTVTCTATSGDDTPSTVSQSFTVTVIAADKPLTITNIGAASSGFDAVAGVTFTDADTNGNLTQYTAMIDWGDRSTFSAATVVRNPFGGFAAGGSHRYAKSAVYTVTVTVKDVGGATVSRTTTLRLSR